MPPLPDLNRLLARASPALREVLSRVAAQAEAPTWLVGGCLRDLVAGRVPFDVDLAVASNPRRLAERLAAAFGGSPFALDEDRATYRVVLSHAPALSVTGEAAGVKEIDIAALRGNGIAADLLERDFTMDAMAAALTPGGLGPLIDPLGGAKDIRRRLVRMTSERALDGDPLRLLRAVRLAIELDFEIEPSTASAIIARAGLIDEVAGERRREELARMFVTGRAATGLRLMNRLGLLDAVFPESAAGRGVEQPGDFHFYDVLDHGIEAVAVLDAVFTDGTPGGSSRRLVGAQHAAPSGVERAFDAGKLEAMRDALWRTLGSGRISAYFAEAVGGHSRLVLTKLATFLHDVSKPETKSVDADGRVRFLGHSEKGALVARDVCRRLRFGNRETAFVSKLVEEHLRPAQLAQSGAPTDRAIFRFFRDAGDAAPAVLVLSLADAAAAVGPPLTLERWQRQLNYVGYVLERGQSQALIDPYRGGKRHFVSGATLIRELDIAPGPDVGRLLAAIDEAAAGGELSTEEEAIDLARTLIRTNSGAA